MGIKPGFKLVALWVLAGLLLLAVPARAEMYVEAYLGGNFAGSPTDSNSGHWANAGAAGPFIFKSSGHIDPAVAGGLKLGTWFVREGFLGLNYPDWMKYLGFYLDFSYHRLDFRRNMPSPATAIPVFWTLLGESRASLSGPPITSSVSRRARHTTSRPFTIVNPEDFSDAFSAKGGQPECNLASLPLPDNARAGGTQKFLIYLPGKITYDTNFTII